MISIKFSFGRPMVGPVDKPKVELVDRPMVELVDRPMVGPIGTLW